VEAIDNDEIEKSEAGKIQESGEASNEKNEKEDIKALFEKDNFMPFESIGDFSQVLHKVYLEAIPVCPFCDASDWYHNRFLSRMKCGACKAEIEPKLAALGLSNKVKFVNIKAVGTVNKLSLQTGKSDPEIFVKDPDKIKKKK
jgi:hypothetical protein